MSLLCMVLTGNPATSQALDTCARGGGEEGTGRTAWLMKNWMLGVGGAL